MTMETEWIEAFDAAIGDTNDEPSQDYYCSDCGVPAQPPGRGQTCTATGRCKTCWWEESETTFITQDGLYRQASDFWVVPSDGNLDIGGAVELFRRTDDDGGEVFIAGLDKVQLAVFIHDAENAVMRNVKRFDARQWKAERCPRPVRFGNQCTVSRR